MRKNIRNSFKRVAGNVASFANRNVAKIGTGFAALAASGAASAQDGLGAAALAKLGTLEGDTKSILILLVGVTVLFILYAYIKRAK
ncbi:hypothetical protein [Lysobacter capsici]|uniref:hypothetical protein n=1 Tax=Lysobacter capsici TaxID=435897 RepID=UPI000627922B|nr:hypothetical protein [Lysobacter capsici]